MIGHIILGLEGIVLVFLLKRWVKRQITEVTIKFNGHERELDGHGK